jgi:hypothetical protein
MLGASGSIAGTATALDVVLGVGVMLLFAGIVLRALAAERHNLARVWLLRAPVRATSPRAPSPDRVLCASSAASHRQGAGNLPAGADPRIPRPPEPAAPPRVECPARPAGADVEARRSAVTVPDVPDPERSRLPPASVRRLGRTLDESRRLHAAEECVAGKLAALPEGLWLVERNVQIGVGRIPFLALGTGGIFVICATDGAWTLRDLHVLSALGEDVRRQLPGYDGAVHAAVCLAFDEMKPRSWFGGQDERGRGGWVLGLDWLRTWMVSLGPERGLLGGDIRRLDEAAGPYWERRSTARLPATRNPG